MAVTLVGGAERDSDPRVIEIFGPAAKGGQTLTEIARASDRMFVRSQTHVARWSNEAKGATLTAFEALEAFGWTKLAELAEHDVVPIVRKGCEASAVLRHRRETMGIEAAPVARKTGLPLHEVEAAEAGKRRVPIRSLTKLAQALALDPLRLGTVRLGGGDDDLGVRFREVAGQPGVLSHAVVLGLAEAAWVIAEQHRLERWLDQSRAAVRTNLGFHPVPLNLSEGQPWRAGIELARQTRELLGLGERTPLRKLIRMVETSLAIPVLQIDMPERFGGATIANNEARGIAVNVNGSNSSVWTRRMTVAHELGHLLWDTDADLNKLKVDEYDALERDARVAGDPIEARANAFAAELLLPQKVAVEMFQQGGKSRQSVSAMMQEFGVSATVAKWQIYNGLYRTPDLAAIRPETHTQPSDDWEAEEGWTTDFFPLQNSFARRGRFAEICFRAYESEIISARSAADYLGASIEDFEAALPALRNLLSL